MSAHTTWMITAFDGHKSSTEVYLVQLPVRWVGKPHHQTAMALIHQHYPQATDVKVRPSKEAHMAWARSGVPTRTVEPFDGGML